ncbi:C40 family peptidase [Actinomadura fibrosa]|uniref:NlpC/P60 family protein n=1 Tax=Actinomadura fibrosa TaxID=111802 RepID=A0ABW2XJS6_9ACTN|nr:NlpC/P60 family protein [Actinomadura fibrosa]
MAPSTPLRRRPPRAPFTGLGAGLRLLALTSGAVLGMSLLVPVAWARSPVDPSPSAQDVRQGERDVRERAAEVGRTKAELAEADGELNRLAMSAEAAVERYNGERVRLERAQAAYRDTRARLAEATRRVGETQAEMAAFAARAYQHDTGYDQVPSVLMGEGGPQGFMDRAGMVEVLAARRAGILRRVEASKNVAEVFRKQAEAAFREQSAATRRAEDAKRSAQEAVAGHRASVGRIEAEKRRLERRLGEARAHVAELRQARQEAQEAREAREAQEAQQAREAEQAREAAGAAVAVTGSQRPATSAARGALVARAALRWLGTPYSWGGGTVDGPSYGIEHGSGIVGFDCSGLAMYAWAKVGVRLDHWTGTQWTSGPHVPLGALRQGDLVFFARNTSDPDTIHHVGIYIGGDQMVEAPYTGARVRISDIHRNDLIGATRPAG